MSDEKAITVCVGVVFVALFAACLKGCEEHEKTQRLKASAPTAVTCVEHSVFDRVQVVE